MKTDSHRGSIIELVAILALFFLIVSIGYATANFGLSQTYSSNAQQQGSFDFIGGVKPIGALPTGGSLSPNDNAYCLEDEDRQGCQDNTAYIIPKSTTGILGPCGLVINQVHKIAPFLQRSNSGLLDGLINSIDDCNYSTGEYQDSYQPTFLVIDAYNLAGFRELSKDNPRHTSGKNLLNWWKSSPKGYKFIPYSTTSIYQYANGQRDLTGCVFFINQPSGVHVGIINSFQLVNPNGDGVLAVLQSGVSYLIERYDVVGWKIKNITLNANQPNSVVGFGCKQ